MQPLLSIVIANYNYGRFLDEAIQSVLSQSCQDFELIVIDGGSSDNSVEVIKRYEDRIAYWISEKDKGQSNAFNKGFAKAKGWLLTWLNADDVMLPGTIEKLKVAVKRYPKCEWFVGGCFWLDPEMKIVNMGRGRPFSEIRYREGNVSVWGPSSFFTKRLLDAVGGVDERFHYMMDTDLWLKFASKQSARYKPFCKYAWGLRLHPAAKMSGHKFDANGKLINRILSDEERYEKQKKVEDQKAREHSFIIENFTPRKKSKLMRFLSIDWPRAVMARFDLMRYHGEHYLEYFK